MKKRGMGVGGEGGKKRGMGIGWEEGRKRLIDLRQQRDQEVAV